MSTGPSPPASPPPSSRDGDRRNPEGGALVTGLTGARAVLATPLFLAGTLGGALATLAIAPFHARRGIDALIRTWASASLRLFSIHVDAGGLENLPPAERGGCLFLFNHQSHFDIPVIHSVVHRTMRFGAKIELFKIPFFGAGMRVAGVLPIARDNRAEVFRVYAEAKAKFADGWSFILAPEGTRQEEPRIGPFKKGPFLFALDAQVPLVPIVLKGTIDILPKGHLGINVGRWSRTVHLRVLPPVETRGLGRENLAALMDAVRAKMVEAYEAL